MRAYYVQHSHIYTLHLYSLGGSFLDTSQLSYHLRDDKTGVPEVISTTNSSTIISGFDMSIDGVDPTFGQASDVSHAVPQVIQGLDMARDVVGPSHVSHIYEQQASQLTQIPQVLQAHNAHAHNTHNTYNTHGTHDTHDIHDTHDTHDIHDTYNTHDTHDIHDTYNTHDTHNTHDTYNTHDIHDTHNTHNTHNTHDTHDTHNLHNTHNTQDVVGPSHASTSHGASHISDVPEEHTHQTQEATQLTQMRHCAVVGVSNGVTLAEDTPTHSYPSHHTLSTTTTDNSALHITQPDDMLPHSNPRRNTAYPHHATDVYAADTYHPHIHTHTHLQHLRHDRGSSATTTRPPLYQKPHRDNPNPASTLLSGVGAQHCLP